MKEIEVFGITMSSIQEMKFSKYLENNNIAMNTFQKEERTKITRNWLCNHLSKST